MIAVLFIATVKATDAEYDHLVGDLRRLAFDDYGCLDLISTSDGTREVTISYWPSLEHVRRWKADPLHRYAQEQGYARWYHTYTVQITRVEHTYDASSSSLAPR